MASAGNKGGGKRPAKGVEKSGTEGAAGGASPNHRAASGQPLIDLDFVRGLIAAVDESGIDSLEISRAGTRIRVAKTPAQVAAPPMAQGAAAPVAVPVAAPVAAAAAQETVSGGAAGAQAGGAEAGGAEESPLHEIKSPMVGTFYRSPAPEAPAYVEVGSSISKGQTLCILEAMKLMNELESEVEGVVREVLVENAEPVEYGQVLFRVETAAAR